MNRQGKQESDYCDLDPTKVCDNCCRCLDMDKQYNEVEAELSRTDRIDDGALLEFPLDFYEEEEGGQCDASQVAPIEIDPALKEEWETRLKAYEAEQKAAYMRTLRGVRKKQPKDGEEE
ncbi:MAG: hypothetical protein EOM66_10910 [Clostridia bacterium]|nr:hypothetical protein [Clostridia bacterium]